MANSQENFTPKQLIELNRMGNIQVSPDGNYLLYSITKTYVESNNYNTDLYLLDLKTNKTKQLTNASGSENNAQWTGDNSIYYLARYKDTNTIWKTSVDGSQKTKISSVKGIQAFKITPDESKIITLQSVKVAQTINDVYPDLPKANARVESDLMYRHWDHWNNHHATHLFYYPVKNGKISGKRRDLLEGEPYNATIPPFGGIGGITFTPDFTSVIYASKKMLGKEFATSTNSQLYKVELESGKTTQLNFSKEQLGYDRSPSFSSLGEMAWMSMKRDGFESDKNDLFVHLKDGKTVNLTGHEDMTVADYSWSSDGQKIYFLAPTMGTFQLFEVIVKTKKVTQLTKGTFDLTSLSIHGEIIYAGRQSMIAPTDAFRIDLKHEASIKQLTYVNETILSKINLPKVEEKWVKTTDGQNMLVWMVLPPNFDATKKHPTLLYCQGGPQGEVSQFFSYRWNFMLMASQGYVVVAPNRRGLPGFGRAWNDAISKDWGGQAIKDYLSAIDAATELPYVDASKLGAVGASYGGYSVYMLAGVHKNRFKTFIAHAGLFDLRSWYGTTEELFFANWDIGGPYWLEENKELYPKNSPSNFVKNWNTPILVIHGGKDFRVPETQGMQAFQAAQLKGIKSKFLYFPTENHWILNPQNAIVWQREFFNWLKETL